MQTRAVREGSVGLLILLGIGIIGGLFLWLRGVTLGERKYNVLIEFPNVNGLQPGAPVRFRGVNVGKISNVSPRSNGVEVEVEISPADLVIPRDVLVEANQSGIISEVSIDITPQDQIKTGEVAALPLDPNCDRSLIVCNGSQLQGRIGISTDEFIRASTRFLNVYSNEQLYGNINAAAKNASVAAAEVSQLTRELASLTKVTRQQVSGFSATTNSIQKAANQLTTTTDKTATQFRSTAADVSRLVNNLDSLVSSNRSSLVTSLNNLTQTSQQLRTTVNSLAPTVNRVTQGQLIQNLETLTANAAQASANLRDVSKALNSPTNLATLQQTLDSARVTFQNSQKITSDLDELTGDPAFRNNLRDLVNGLSSLVSSTQQIEQQVQVAQTLDSVTAAVKHPETGMNFNPNYAAVTKVPTLDRRQETKIAKPLTKAAQPQWLLKLKQSSNLKSEVGSRKSEFRSQQEKGDKEKFPSKI